MKSTESEQSRVFHETLRALTKSMSHREIAEYLNSSLDLSKGERVELWQIRNWLYRDRPTTWAIRIFLPAMNGKLKALKK